MQFNAGEVRKELRKHASPEKAKVLQRFFRTGPGDYGEGDIFLGLKVPETRVVAKKFSSLSLPEVEKLLESGFHEERLAALLILVQKFSEGSDEEKKRIFDFYLGHSSRVNNWDLVDLSADKIAGEYLFGKDKAVLRRLAGSNGLWERRISIVATYAFIKKNSFDDTLAISGLLLRDKHDLIHKAVGWMLREVGKRNQSIEEEFLEKHYRGMPRTMLRYAIERFSEKKRKAYLEGKI